MQYPAGGDNVSVRALAALAAVISVLAAALALPSAESARTACPYQAQVITYNPRGWQPLLDSLAANQTPCAQYYVVLPPLEDKVTPRGRRLVEAVRSKGANFHPVAEFSWKGWYGKPGSWYSKGVSFRRKMAAAGYDPRRGETWAINELPSTIRSRTDTRQRARDLIRGLYTGPPRSAPSAGAVFIVGVGQEMRNFGPYKASLRGWLQDAAFWTAITPHVAWWGQETYVSCSRVCAPGARVRIAERSTATNDFTQHTAKLAYAGPPATAAARAFFDKAWTPVMTAFWRDAKGLREQPDPAGHDDEVRLARGVRGSRVGGAKAVPRRAHRVRLEPVTAGRAARGDAAAGDAACAGDPGRLRRRRHRGEGLQPAGRLHVVRAAAPRRRLQRRLEDLRDLVVRASAPSRRASARRAG